MKKKLFILISLFTLVFSLIIGSAATVILSHPGSHAYTKLNSTNKSEALSISGDIILDVGEEYDFSDKFKLYVKDSEKEELTYQIEDDSVIYLNTLKHKFIALKAGTTKLIISSDKYYTELNITVNIINFCDDGDFETLEVGTKWQESNAVSYGWRLYSGGTTISTNPKVQLIDVQDYENSGNNVIHMYHAKPTSYANLYKEYNVVPGQYYVTAKMKGNDVLKDAYVRVNQGYDETTTSKIKGTFDWETFTSKVVRVEEGKKLKIELYFANNSGELWFDDIKIFRVLETKYNSFSVEKTVEKLNVGQTTQIISKTEPASIIDFEYDYTSSNESVAKVDKLGNITAVANGIATITVTDKLYNYSNKVKVLVGKENGITADPVFSNITDGVLVVNEDSVNSITLNVTGTSNYDIYKYSNPKYGNYYIMNNKIVYSPNADYYTLGENYDSFEVVVFDKDKGYVVVEILVKIINVIDESTTVEFWHTTDKNTNLEWSISAGSNYYVINSNNEYIYNGGYIQVLSNDVEGIYPEIYKKNMGANTSEQDQYIAAKNALYANIYATANDNSFELTSANGGTVKILDNGKVQQIYDRYYSSQNKVIHGVLYDYIPKEGFTGYDTFEFVVHNGDNTVKFSNKVYVAPGLDDFKFDELDFSGTYVISNSEWLEEVAQGYKNGDEYIKTWVEFYEAQYKNHIPTRVPATARTPMEQLAILYKVTGNKEYFTKCWNEMVHIVKDENFLEDKTKRASWGEDSNGFLDAAMVTYSVAFTYNYIKDDLTDAQKEMVMKALYEEGFYYFENLNNVNVLLHGNNHNLLVCGDLAIAALSAMSYEGNISVRPRDIKPEDPDVIVNVREMAAEVVQTAFKYLQIGLVHYSETGGFPEGPSYSIYAHRNMVSLLSTLGNLYGMEQGKINNSFGLDEIEGIMNYINYPLYTSSPNYQSFYYAESDYSNNQPALLWYTRLNEDDTSAAILAKLAYEQEAYNIQNLLYYKPGLFEKIDYKSIQQLDFLLEEHELATFRSEFGNEMAIFTGLKGTDSDSGAFAHKNMDSGTFELYALGERFIGNFSNETYNVVVPDGYWDYNYGRWEYYKKSAQGHNTLVINPEDEKVLFQDPNEKAPIIDFKTNEFGGYSVIDLSRVYKKNALSAIRGLKLFDNRSQVLVQDEFTLRKESTLYWSAHTEARIEIVNEKLARLTINGKSLYAYIASELGTFTQMSANEPLPGTVGDFCNLDNEGINKLVIKLENIIEGTLSVVFLASLEDVSEFKTYSVTPIKNWTLENGTKKADITVENITFDAELANNTKYIFNPYQYEYVVKLDNEVTSIPNFEVTYDKEKYNVEIIKAKVFNNLTKIKVTDLATNEFVEYSYKFIVDVIISGYDEYERLDVVNVSGHKDASKLIDGSNTSTLVSNTKEEVIFEFADIKEFTNVLIRYAGGMLNTYYFDIYYSEDGTNYECCYFGGQSNKQMGDEVYTIGNVKAKYVKIVFNGNTVDQALKVVEVGFLKNPVINTTNSSSQKGGCGGGCGGSLAGSLIGLVTICGAIVLAKKRKED